MRRFTLVQDIATDVDGHWKLFLDPTFDRTQYEKGCGFPAYEVLEHRDRVRVTPKLDLPAVVAKAAAHFITYNDPTTLGP